MPIVIRSNFAAVDQPKKIAFVCHPYHRGGVTRWMADAAIAAADAGHGAYFVTVDPTNPFQSGAGREKMVDLLPGTKDNLTVISTKVSFEFEFGTMEYRTWVYKKLIALLPAGTPLILSDDTAVWNAAAELQSSYFIVGVLHADEPYYYRLAEKYHSRTDAFVCVSERIKKEVIRLLPGFSASAVYTIPCGIQLPQFHGTTASDNILKLIYVGRVSSYQKRVGDLLKTCLALDKLHSDFHLLIVGDGDAKTQLANDFNQNALARKVTFSGWVPQLEVASYLAAADILLLTSDFEGTPIAMMEALSNGCAVVGTRVSGLEDYEFHPRANDCISLFSVGDVEDAARKIIKISRAPRINRRSAARALAESAFSMAACLAAYYKIGDRGKSFIPPNKIKIPVLDLFYSRALALARWAKVKLIK